MVNELSIVLGLLGIVVIVVASVSFIVWYLVKEGYWNKLVAHAETADQLE